MGLGIAQVCAVAGHEVVLADVQESALQKALATIQSNLEKSVSIGKLNADALPGILNRLSLTTDINQLTCDLAIEAIVERLDVKQDLFRKLAAVNGISCILATNTSSIPITRIAAGIEHPERIIGLHFFNPAHIMKLVEIVNGAHTSPEISAQMKEFVLGLGKTPIIAADAPGFIVNRVARHYYVEALKMLEEGVASLEDIDDLMESAGFKMGPFRLMDLIGVDTNFSVTSSMFELFHQDPKFRPSRIQQQKVEAGFHGRKSGKGFYTYH